MHPAPKERDVSGEELKIGLFVCHCGANIGGQLLSIDSFELSPENSCVMPIF